MTYNAPNRSEHCLTTLTAVLDERSYYCDPDFDGQYDELERQFAELRLTSRNDYPVLSTLI